ncbi:MAG: GntR family transcriptional regulator [Eubacteriales bacterium]
MKWKFDNDKPIYVQIVNRLKADIITGNYELGGEFPSVRDLAEIASVNPNTMQKALVELEREGLVITNRASGRMVTDNEARVQEVKEEMASQKVEVFLTEIYQLGYSLEEVVELVKGGKKDGVS